MKKNAPEIGKQLLSKLNDLAKSIFFPAPD